MPANSRIPERWQPISSQISLATASKMELSLVSKLLPGKSHFARCWLIGKVKARCKTKRQGRRCCGAVVSSASLLRDLREKVSAPTMRSVISGYAALRAARLVGKCDSIGAKEKLKVGRAVMMITSDIGAYWFAGRYWWSESQCHNFGENVTPGCWGKLRLVTWMLSLLKFKGIFTIIQWQRQGTMWRLSWHRTSVIGYRCTYSLPMRWNK